MGRLARSVGTLCLAVLSACAPALSDGNPKNRANREISTGLDLVTQGLALGESPSTFPGAIQAIDCDPTGRVLLIGCKDGRLYRWNVAEARPIEHIQFQAGDFIRCLRISPSGKTALLGFHSGYLRTWDLERGNPTKEWQAHGGPINDVEFSRDGRFAFSSGKDSDVIRWDASLWKRVDRLEGHATTSLLINDDGESATIADGSGRLLRWQVLTSKIESLTTLGGQITDMVEAKASRRTFFGTFEGKFGSSSALSPARPETHLVGIGRVSSMATDAEGRQILIATDRQIILWDTKEERAKPALEKSPRETYSVCLSPDGRFAFAGGEDGLLRTWSTAGGRLINRPAHDGRVTSLAAAGADEVWIATEGGTLEAWQVSLRNRRLAIEAHSEGALAVSCSPDGRQVLTGGADGSASVWDRQTGAHACKLRGVAEVRGVDWSLDGDVVLTGSSDGALTSWNRESGQTLWRIDAHLSGVLAVKCTLDGSFVVTGGEDGLAHLWDLRQGRHVRTYQGHSGPLTGVALVPDGRRLVTCSLDGSVIIWNLETAAKLQTIPGEGRAVRAVACSPDGQYVVAGGGSNSIRVLNVDSGALEYEMRGHVREINALMFMPSGRRIVSGSSDMSVMVWNPALADEQVVRASTAQNWSAIRTDVVERLGQSSWPSWTAGAEILRQRGVQAIRSILNLGDLREEADLVARDAARWVRDLESEDPHTRALADQAVAKLGKASIDSLLEYSSKGGFVEASGRLNAHRSKLPRLARKDDLVAIRASLVLSELLPDRTAVEALQDCARLRSDYSAILAKQALARLVK